MKRILTFVLLLGLTVPSFAQFSGSGAFGRGGSGSGGSSAFTHSGSKTTLVNSGDNVGIGSATPGQKLDVNGTVMANAFQTNGSGESALTLTAQASNVSVPATGYGSIYEKTDKTLYFQDDAGSVTSLFGGNFLANGTNTYLSPTTNNVGVGTFSVSSGSKFIVTGGNVGLGTLNPSAALEVFSSSLNQIRSVGTNANVLTVGTGSVGLGVKNTTSGKDWRIESIRNAPTGSLEINNVTDSLNTITISQAGNVGISTTGPSSLFQVGTNKFNVLSGGNVGIGSPTPNQKLDIQSDAGVLKLDHSTTSSYNQLGFYEGGTAKGSLSYLGTAFANGQRQNTIELGAATSGIDITFLPGGTESMRLKGTNVGIGSITPGSALDIQGGLRVLGSGTVGSVKTGANTACTTTCGTSKCLLGEDTAAIGTIVSCSDATADVCVCLGP